MRTDHRALSYLQNFKDPEEQMARLLQMLDMYDFDMELHPGRKNNNADALSWGP